MNLALTLLLEYPPRQLWTGRVLISSVVPNPEQPRTVFDAEELQRLAESLDEMQIQPILVMAFQDPKRPEVKWMIVDGERRWRGLQSMKSESILICFNPDITAANIHEKSFAANFCRSGHTHLETAKAIDRQVKAGHTYVYIAKLIGKSSTWVQNEHKVLKLAPDLMPLVDSKSKLKHERMSVRTAALLSEPTFDKQREQWRKLQGVSFSQQYTQLRFSGDIKAAPSVHRGRQRSDVTVLHGQLQSAERSVHVVANIPKARLLDLSEAELLVLENAVGKVEAQLQEVRRRIQDTRQEQHE